MTFKMPQTDPDSDRPFLVLAIDGGGIRGIIAAEVLTNLEKQLGKPLAECFDLIAGTSTGGILAAGITVKDPQNPDKPLYTAADMGLIYKEQGGRIFRKNFLRSALNLILPRYPESFRREVFEECFGNATFGDCLTNVLIPTYDIRRHEVVVMKHRPSYPKEDKYEKVSLADILCRTSAAPIYFPPAKDREQALRYIDGGMYANNPALLAAAEAVKLAKPGQKIVVVSVGTGHMVRPIEYESKIFNDIEFGASGWMFNGVGVPLIETFMNANASMVDKLLYRTLGQDYIRVDLGFCEVNKKDRPNEEMDDASPENIRKLIKFGKTTVKRQKTELSRIVDIVNHNIEQRDLEKFYAAQRTSVNQLKLVDPADYAPPKAVKQPETPLAQEENDPDEMDEGSLLKNNEIAFTLADTYNALKGSAQQLLPKLPFRWPGQKP